MKIEINKLKRHFGRDFENILKQASDTLDFLGLQLIVFKNNLTIQFDYEKVARDPVSLLIFCIITGSDPPKEKTLSKMAFSKLSRPELAILVNLLALIEEEKRTTIPMSLMKTQVSDIISDRIVSKSLTRLARKGYISFDDRTISIDWRLQVELGFGVSKISTLFKDDELKTI